jgi:Brp/Blh family beta-carotene 15,15'-monooxygenase
VSSSFRLLRAGFVAALGLVAAFSPVDESVAGWALALALLVGLPHGALDHLLHPDRDSTRGQVGFHLGYLVVCGVLALGWFVAPTAAFLLFVATSALHFGQSDLLHAPGAGRSFVAIASRGALLVVAPLFAQPDVSAALASLTGAAPAALPIPDGGLATAVPLFLVLHLAALWFSAATPTRFFELAIDAFALAILLTGAGVTLGLALYFVVWHTPDHFAAVHDTDRELRSVVPRTLATLFVVAIAAAVFDPTYWPRLIVLSIAVLSIPHALVVHLATTVHAGPRLGATGPDLEVST